MNKWLAVVVLVLLVLTSAVGLKRAAGGETNAASLMANSTVPMPPSPGR